MDQNDAGGARLGKDVFLALFAVAWADGDVAQDEADAIVRAAVDEGLELEDIQEIEASAATRVEISFLDRSAMTKEDRMFVYAVACWIANMDGRVTDQEAKTLALLGDKLGVPERPRALAESIAREVAALPDGDRPVRYDLSRVRRLIDERFKKAQETARVPG